MTRIITMNRPGAVSSSCSCHSRAAGVTARSSPWTHPVQHTAAGEGAALTAPDAVLTVKIDARHTDGGYELFEADGFDLEPGSSITIPPAALHTFTVLSPMAKFLVVILTGAMGAFHADLDATVLHGRSIEETAQQIQQVLSPRTPRVPSASRRGRFERPNRESYALKRGFAQ